MDSRIMVIATGNAILVGAGLATFGWVYTARRHRRISRKQHTFNVLLHMSFNEVFLKALKCASTHFRDQTLPDLLDEANVELRRKVRIILNHYEFMAAGVRNGDLDEQLLRDSERGVVVQIYESCQHHIYSVRNTRQRQSINEHLEWLYKRWNPNPPRRTKRLIEWALGRPLQGQRIKVN
ncbi:MAG: DUF4760 domain-containing protein [Proteobacteria bacterium]|nr:DUF4760 domain-containing protein [Pseudomonadota bacterium]